MTRTTGRRKPIVPRNIAAGTIAVVLVVAVLVPPYPQVLYPWIKAVHVVAVMAWMAGLLYLPRLFVYHSDVPAGSQASETFKLMESRLYRLIMTPAMLLSWILGLWLLGSWFSMSGARLWLAVKLAAVLALTFVHGYFGKSMRRFAADRRDRTARHWRIVNEIPTLLMIAIVIMAIVKPF